MASVIRPSNFHEGLIFDLIERLLDYAMDMEGINFLNPKTIGLLLRAAQTTEGLPSMSVRDVCVEIFLSDIWEKVHSYERRPGVIRRFAADRLVLASLTD